MTPVTKIIIDQLQLSKRWPNCLNCVYQNCCILSWLQVLTNLVSNANMLLIYAQYTVKSVIKYYNYFSSPVYTCFLDASTAFDKVNHWTLFKKLLIKRVPVILVRILCIWYRCQQLCIQWGKLNTRSLLCRMVYGRAGFYLPNYILSTWMTYLIY